MDLPFFHLCVMRDLHKILYKCSKQNQTNHSKWYLEKGLIS